MVNLLAKHFVLESAKSSTEVGVGRSWGSGQGPKYRRYAERVLLSLNRIDGRRGAESAGLHGFESMAILVT